jgi:uncharacterized surface protein with fasciclin (FAS1) repeats
MDFGKRIMDRSRQLIGKQRLINVRFLILWILLYAVMTSCESKQSESDWFDGENSTIGQYLDANRKEYSKFYRLLVRGKMLSPLYAYNPHSDGYTLFLPTDSAIDNFIRQNTNYGTFEKMLLDTGFVYNLTRYHTVNRKVHTDEFPDGALNDKNLTGDRLIMGFFTDGNNQLIKVNNTAPIIKSNLKQTNGYVHIISEVLHKAETGGYDWLQQQADYSILAKAMELAGIRGKLKWTKYTILAEHDSVFHRIGINKTEDLINRIATPGVPLSGSTNAFYLFTAYHILNGEYYLNDFNWGEYKYTTLANKFITVDAGQEIRLNPGIEIFGTSISAYGDTIVTDYILPVWDASNRLTLTGPVHSISRVLDYEPFPK